MSAPRFRDVTLPIDFSPMGINFIIQPGMKGLIDSIMAYKGWDIFYQHADGLRAFIKDYENGTTESRMTTLKDLRGVIEWGSETI
jgi:hypothetical protein